MKDNLKAQSGLALILGSLIMIATMILHPAGGNIEHLRNISTIIIVSHSLAILSLPFTLFGFWGLTRTLGIEDFLSVLAFTIMLFGLFAVMIAAAANGLCLPLYIDSLGELTKETTLLANAILDYNFALNKAMDFIYIVATCLSVLLWSIIIVRDQHLSKWIGYYGLIISFVGIVSFISGIVLHDLYGFRLFVFGLASWIVITGYLMFKSPGIPK